MSSPSIPLNACSMGMVTRLSTSAAVSPRHAVWICTRGGANSGNTSTGICRNAPTPKIIIATATGDDEVTEPQAVLMIQRIMARRRPPRRYSSSPTPISAPYSSAAPTLTTLVPAGGPSVRNATSPSMWSTVIGFRTKVSALDVDERPGVALGVVEDRAVGDLRPWPPPAARDGRRLDVEAPRRVRRSTSPD